jgi:very-short-patch-repair endonuclease
MARTTIRRWCDRGLLVREVRGVVRVASAPRSAHQRLMAAVLALGDGAVASHISAAALWELGDVALAPPFHLTVPRYCRIDLGEGFVVHRSSTLERLDTTRLGRIPVTSVPRTVADNSDVGDVDLLEDLVIDGMRRWGMQGHEVEAALDRVPPNQPRATLLELLRSLRPDQVRSLLSALERDYLVLFRRAGLEPTAVNRRLHAPDGCLVAMVDLLWEPPGVVAEVDGLRFHSTRRQKEHDDRRQNAIVLTGRLVLRYSSRDLDEPDRVIREVRQALELAAR